MCYDFAMAKQVAARPSGAEMQVVACSMPTEFPWLNLIEPRRLRGKRRLLTSAELVTVGELEERVCAARGTDHADHLTMPK
jgi:hypothetical protein